MTHLVTTICGSMRYYYTIISVAEQLSAQGEIVLMPFSVKKYVPLDGITETLIATLDAMHRQRIDMSSRIVVVGRHIGSATRSEINYAKLTGKPVYYWNGRAAVAA